MNKTTAMLLGGAAALALTLSACSSSNPTGTPSTTGTGSSFSNTNAKAYADLKTGGTINVSIGEFTPQKNQFQADGTTDTWTFWDWYNAELIKFKPNGDTNINPNYLTSAKADTVNGKTVVTYEVNPKAQFNDGTPIDIKAFQNTWKQNNGSDKAYNANSTDGWNKIESVEQGKDAREIVVTFVGPWPWWGGLFNTLQHPACNTPECYNTGYLGTDLKSAHPEWGAGPYKLDTFDANAGTATFVKNDKWWGDPGKLDKITMVQREATAAVNAFVNGETDWVGATSADILTQVKSVPGTETRQGANVANYMLQLNGKSATLSDAKVRQAIMTGFDRSKIAQVQFQGLNYTEPLPGSLLLFSYQPGYVDNFSKAVPKVDVAAAKKLLEDAGYTLGSDGYYAKGGKQLAVGLTIFNDLPATKARAQVTQSELKNIGINVTIVQKASADFSTIMSKGDWEMNISGFASSDPYGVAYTCQIWCSPEDDNYSGLNKSGLGTVELDKKIHDMEALPTAEEQIKAANDIEVAEFQQFGLMPLFNGPVIYQVKSSLANVGSAVFAGKSSAVGDFRENIGYMA